MHNSELLILSIQIMQFHPFTICVFRKVSKIIFFFPAVLVRPGHMEQLDKPVGCNIQKPDHQENDSIHKPCLPLDFPVLFDGSFIEIVAFTVNDNDHGKILHFQFADGLCPQIFIGDDL